MLGGAGRSCLAAERPFCGLCKAPGARGPGDFWPGPFGPGSGGVARRLFGVPSVDSPGVARPELRHSTASRAPFHLFIAHEIVDGRPWAGAAADAVRDAAAGASRAPAGPRPRTKWYSSINGVSF